LLAKLLPVITERGVHKRPQRFCHGVHLSAAAAAGKGSIQQQDTSALSSPQRREEQWGPVRPP